MGIDTASEDISTLSATTIRDQVKEVEFISWLTKAKDSTYTIRRLRSGLAILHLMVLQ